MSEPTKFKIPIVAEKYIRECQLSQVKLGASITAVLEYVTRENELPGSWAANLETMEMHRTDGGE